MLVWAAILVFVGFVVGGLFGHAYGWLLLIGGIILGIISWIIDYAPEWARAEKRRAEEKREQLLEEERRKEDYQNLVQRLQGLYCQSLLCTNKASVPTYTEFCEEDASHWHYYSDHMRQCDRCRKWFCPIHIPDHWTCPACKVEREKQETEAKERAKRKAYEEAVQSWRVSIRCQADLHEECKFPYSGPIPTYKEYCTVGFIRAEPVGMKQCEDCRAWLCNYHFAKNPKCWSCTARKQPAKSYLPTSYYPSAPSTEPTDAQKARAAQQPSIYEGQVIGGTRYHRGWLVPGTGEPYYPGPINPATGKPFPRGPLGPGGQPFRPPRPPGP